MSKLLALAGNPNVGKSTIFNALTKMHQHTGNWPEKTVENAVGYYNYKKETYQVFDLPGTYSLISSSKEEEIARDFLCFSEQDVTVVVCDATNLRRNLNLVLQILELKDNVVVVINLLDEAKKKNIVIDLKQLSNLLDVPVVGCTARNKDGLEELKEVISNYKKKNIYKITYSTSLEEKIKEVMCYLKKYELSSYNTRWLSLRLLEKDNLIMQKLSSIIGKNLEDDEEFKQLVNKVDGKIIQEEIIRCENKSNELNSKMNEIEKEMKSEVEWMKKVIEQKTENISRQPVLGANRSTNDVIVKKLEEKQNELEMRMSKQEEENVKNAQSVLLHMKE